MNICRSQRRYMRRYFPLIAENAVVVAALMGYEYGNYGVLLHVTFPL